MVDFAKNLEFWCSYSRFLLRLCNAKRITVRTMFLQEYCVSNSTVLQKPELIQSNWNDVASAGARNALQNNHGVGPRCPVSEFLFLCILQYIIFKWVGRVTAAVFFFIAIRINWPIVPRFTHEELIIEAILPPGYCFNIVIIVQNQVSWFLGYWDWWDRVLRKSLFGAFSFDGHNRRLPREWDRFVFFHKKPKKNLVAASQCSSLSCTDSLMSSIAING